MTKAELLAKLRTQCWAVIEPVGPFGETDDGSIKEYKLATVQMGARGTLKATSVHMIVLGEGTAQESAALSGSPVELPVAETLTAVGYLESLKGTAWNAYEYESGRSDLGFFTINAWVDNGDGTESTQRFRIYTDSNGDPAHVPIV